MINRRGFLGGVAVLPLLPALPRVPVPASVSLLTTLDARVAGYRIASSGVAQTFDVLADRFRVMDVHRGRGATLNLDQLNMRLASGHE